MAVVQDENGAPICSKHGVGAVHGMTVKQNSDVLTIYSILKACWLVAEGWGTGGEYALDPRLRERRVRCALGIHG